MPKMYELGSRIHTHCDLMILDVMCVCVCICSPDVNYTCEGMTNDFLEWLAIHYYAQLNVKFK